MWLILEIAVGVFGVLFAALAANADESGWTQYYRSAAVDEAFRVTADGLGGVYIAGQSADDATGEDSRSFLVKYDSAGGFLWEQKAFGGVHDNMARGLATDPFGGVYVAGVAEGMAGSEGGTDGFLVKFDPDGRKQWEFSVGWDLDDGITGVAAAAEAVCVCGFAGTKENGSDVMIRTYSLNGGELGPPLRFGGSDNDMATDIAMDAQGNMYVVGTTSGRLFGTSAGSTDIFAAKLNPGGGIVWQKQFGTDKVEGATRLAIQGDVVYVSGYTQGSLFGVTHGGTDPIVMALDSSSGTPLWSRQLGSSAMEFAEGVHADCGGNVHLGVWYYTAGPKIFKLDDTHAVVEEHALGSASRGSVRAVYGDGSGTIYVAGREGTNQTGMAYLARLYGEEKVLEGVPDYLWNYGCTPTAAGMMMGYWDRKGFTTLDGDPKKTAPLTSDPQEDSRPREGHREQGTYETGSPNSNSSVDKMIASEGHHEAFWARGLDEGEGANIDYEVDGLPRFDIDFDCLADYLGTSQGRMENGWSPQITIAGGLEDWADEYGHFRDGEVYVGPDDTKPSFEKLKAEIDRDAPVLLSLSLDGTGDDDSFHSVMAYGYIDYSGRRWFAVRDTWQDGDSDSDVTGNEDKKIEAFVDDEEVEWWEWNTKKDAANPKAYVAQMNAFFPITNRLQPKRLFRHSDDFDRLCDSISPDDLGYEVVDLSVDGSGSVHIVPSPVEPENPVLRLTSTTGQAISIAEEVRVDPTMELSFAYLFQDAGEVQIFLDDTLLDLLEPMDHGPGSVGSGEFAMYREIFDVSAMGFAPWSSHSLRFVLKAAGDPTFFMDDLVLLGIPAAPIPEPSNAGLLAATIALSFVISRRRMAVARPLVHAAEQPSRRP